MKSILTLGLALLVATTSFADEKKRKSPTVTAKGPNVEVTYGQPSKNGRVIFGELVPYGKVWRTGANEATEITFKKDATFGGKEVKAGTYSLFTIPGEKKWTIILNSKLEQWGAYEYDKIKGNDVLKTDATVYKLKNEQEKFTISVKKEAVVFEWDNTGVSVPYSVK